MVEVALGWDAGFGHATSPSFGMDRGLIRHGNGPFVTLRSL